MPTELQQLGRYAIIIGEKLGWSWTAKSVFLEQSSIFRVLGEKYNCKKGTKNSERKSIKIPL